MISKYTLNELRTSVEGIKKTCQGYTDDLIIKDIYKSLMILENKLEYYLTNYDALNSHNNVSLEEAEK